MTHRHFIGSLLGIGSSLFVTLLPSVTWAADDDIRLSSIGYLPDRPKVASIIGTAGSNFELRREGDDSVAFTGALSSPLADLDTGKDVRFADFSSVTEPGSYYLAVADIGRSMAFPISADVFARQLTTAMLGYYGWRSGVEVEFQYGEQTFRQGPGHLQDGLLDYLGQTGVTRDGSRGWYDAGDYGKYTVNGAFTLGMMLQAWESFSTGLKTLVLPIPEQGGALPDYLDEVAWEYDWLFTMQYSPTDARVSHKLTSLGFAAFIMPEEDSTPTYYSPYGSASTASFVAAMALGARVYRPYNTELADRMLSAAQASYKWLGDNPSNVAPDISAFSTGAYQTQDSDDRIWAAAEMWETTGDAAALSDFETRASVADSRGNVLDGEFDWSNLRNLGIYTYLRSTRSGRTESVVDALRAALLQAADTLVGNRGKSGYGRASATYRWGGNGTVARNCMSLQVANQLSPNPAYLDACSDQVAHLYGRNHYNRSFVTGVGKDPPLHPHHRPSSSDGVEAPFPGLLVGGPQPQATSWQDVEGDYTTNEVAINWNGALVYALAGFLPNGSAGTGGSGNALGAGGSPGDSGMDTSLAGSGTTSGVDSTLTARGGGCSCRLSNGNRAARLWALLLGSVLVLTIGRRSRRSKD